MKEWPNRPSDTEMKYHDLLQGSVSCLKLRHAGRALVQSAVVFVTKTSHRELPQNSRLKFMCPSHRLNLFILHHQLYGSSVRKKKCIYTVIALIIEC